MKIQNVQQNNTNFQGLYGNKRVLKKLREVHPYEEPGIDIIPLINEEDLII